MQLLAGVTWFLCVLWTSMAFGLGELVTSQTSLAQGSTVAATVKGQPKPFGVRSSF